MRLLKILVVLVILAFLALAGYAYLGDMGPRQQEMRKPVQLDTSAARAPAPAIASATASDAATDTAASDDETTGPTDSNGLD